MLQLRNIRKAYTTGSFTQTALDDVSISFRDSEFVAILGPSGSGKTTLLNIIGLLDNLTEGHYTLNGQDVRHLSDKAKARLGELDHLFRKLYEDNALGRLSDQQFTFMVSGYDDEKAALVEKIRGLEKEVSTVTERRDDVGRFV